MKYRYIIDRIVVIFFAASSLFFSNHWFDDQFILTPRPRDPSLAPGGDWSGLTLTSLIIAICYQLLLSQNYKNKTRDGIVLVLIYGLINMGMVKIGMGLNGAIVTIFSLLLLVYLEEKKPAGTNTIKN